MNGPLVAAGSGTAQQVGVRRGLADRARRALRVVGRTGVGTRRATGHRSPRRRDPRDHTRRGRGHVQRTDLAERRHRRGVRRLRRERPGRGIGHRRLRAHRPAGDARRRHLPRGVADHLPGLAPALGHEHVQHRHAFGRRRRRGRPRWRHSRGGEPVARPRHGGHLRRRPRGGRTVVVLAPVAPRRAQATRRFDGRRAAAPRPVGYGRGARRHRVAGHRLSGPARHGRRIVGRAHRRIVRQRHHHRPDRPGNDAVARRVARPADLPVDRTVMADTDRRAREFTAGPRRLRARRAHPHEGADEGDRRRRHRSHRGGCCMARRCAGVGDPAPTDRGGVAGPGRARRVMGRALRRRCGVGRRDHDERDRAAVVQRPRRHRVRAGVDGEDRTGVGTPGDRREEPARARPGDRGGGGVG